MPHGVFAKKSDFLEIGEYNFSWPGENGTFQDFGSVNYTMPSGMWTSGNCFDYYFVNNNVSTWI